VTIPGISFIPTAAAGLVGVWTAAIALVALIIKMRPIMKKLEHDRIKALEDRFDAADAQRAAERQLHDAEMALVRHRLNGESATLDALVGLLESQVSIPPDTIKRITESRTAAALGFATEMAAITEARIALARAAMPAAAES
jgi:hypothetical protein